MTDISTMSLEDCATAAHIGVRDIRAAIDAGALGHFRIGSKISVPRACFADWIKRNTVQPWTISPRALPQAQAPSDPSKADRITGTQPAAAILSSRPDSAAQTPTERTS